MEAVLIVGAGPTGLSMACELHRHQIPFRIIDKNSHPVKTSNALVAQTRTLEVWDDNGLLNKALSQGNKIQAGNFHFGNKKVTLSFDLIDSLYPFVLGISQHETEQLLIHYLEEKNIHVEREVELTTLTQQENEVTVTLQQAKGKMETLTIPWLIACDGGKSIVRSQLGIDFPGKDLAEHFVLADVKVESSLSSQEIHGFLSAKGPLFIIQYDNDYTRIIAEVTDDEELRTAKSLTLEQINRLIRERSPITMTIRDPLWTSGFWIHEKMLKTYSYHSIFFAGDAAHIHSPAGGQGMNTGIQDAYNLAWKLAWVIRKKAQPAILATYQSERHGVAQAVLRASTLMTHMVSLRNPFLLQVRNTLLPWILKSRWLRKKFAETISELAIAYPQGLLVKECLKEGGQKAGERFLDVRLNEKTSLLDYVRGTAFCLLMFSGKDEVNEKEFVTIAEKISQQDPSIKIILITEKNSIPDWQYEKIIDAGLLIHSRYQVSDARLYLIRPDKYIGFRGRLEHWQELFYVIPAQAGIHFKTSEGFHDGFPPARE